MWGFKTYEYYKESKIFLLKVRNGQNCIYEYNYNSQKLVSASGLVSKQRHRAMNSIVTMVEIHSVLPHKVECFTLSSATI